MDISEAASRSALSIDTIRYYERMELLPPINRGTNGRRRFSAQDVEWLVLLASLRETGMPMERMRHFAQLYRRGDEAISERRQVLLDHSDQLNMQRRNLDRCAKLLAYKLQRYDEMEGLAQ